MRRRAAFAAGVFVLGVAVGALLPAAAECPDCPGCPSCGACPGCAAAVAGEVAIAGEVVAVDRITGGRRPERGAGIHLRVDTGKAVETVRLGPERWLERQPVTIAKGDRVEVRGRRKNADGGGDLVATEVRRGDDVLRLRDETGRPYWGGQGSRGPRR